MIVALFEPQSQAICAIIDHPLIGPLTAAALTGTSLRRAIECFRCSGRGYPLSQSAPRRRQACPVLSPLSILCKRDLTDASSETPLAGSGRAHVWFLVNLNRRNPAYDKMPVSYVMHGAFFVVRAVGGTRTPNLQVRSLLLYPIELRPRAFVAA